MAEFITIASYGNHYDCMLVKNHLEEQGIKCFIDDAAMNSEDLLKEQAPGNIKLNVKPEDSEKALLFIKDLQVSYEEGEQQLFQDDEDDKKWKEEMRLQEEKNFKSGKWGYMIVAIIVGIGLVWLYMNGRK